jgi:hypothetical protein
MILRNLILRLGARIFFLVCYLQRHAIQITEFKKLMQSKRVIRRSAQHVMLACIHPPTRYVAE